ncbi:MAG: hypothetical protein WBE76_16375 [Terracidiphilus sp.]
MTADPPRAVPQLYAERLAKAFAAFVDAVRAAINENVTHPAIANTQAFLAWQTQALPMLEQENATVQRAQALFLIGEERTIVTVAAEERHLAKKLDGLSMDFAGAERAKLLDRLETAIVIAASQICQAAGVP